MPSVTTIYRAAVMVAVGAIVFKAWQVYGPPVEQVKSVVVSALDMAETAWKYRPGTNAESPASAKPHDTAPAFSSAPQSAQLSPMSPGTSAPAAPALAQIPANALTIGDGPLNASIKPNPDPDPMSVAGSGSGRADQERLEALMSRMSQMNVTNKKLSAWGSSGRLYRFCCEAAVNDSPGFTRHFESVAAEPEMAVEQVVAQVQSWRTAQRGEISLR